MNIDGIKWLDFAITYLKIKPLTVIITGGPGGLPPSKNNQKKPPLFVIGGPEGLPGPASYYCGGSGEGNRF